MSVDWLRQPSKNSIEVTALSSLCLGNNKNIRRYKIIMKGAGENIAKIIWDATTLNVKNYDHTIDNYFMRHAYRQHKDDEIPIEKYDYKKIPLVIKKANQIYWDSGAQNAGKNRHSKKKQRNGVLIYVKNYHKGRFIYLEEIRKNRRELAAKTMYWQPKQK